MKYTSHLTSGTGADQSVSYPQVNLKPGSLYAEQPQACPKHCCTLACPHEPKKGVGDRRGTDCVEPLTLLCMRTSAGSGKQCCGKANLSRKCNWYNNNNNHKLVDSYFLIRGGKRQYRFLCRKSCKASNHFVICFPPRSFCSASPVPMKVHLTAIVIIKPAINRNSFTPNPVKLYKASQSFIGQKKPRTE